MNGVSLISFFEFFTPEVPFFCFPNTEIGLRKDIVPKGYKAGSVVRFQVQPESRRQQPCNMDVSKNNGFSPQIIHLFIGFSIIFTIHFGVPLFLETPISQPFFPLLERGMQHLIYYLTIFHYLAVLATPHFCKMRSRQHSKQDFGT